MPQGNDNIASAAEGQTEKDRIRKILDENADKNFVQRILNPKKNPTLDLGNGDFATHKMAWSDDGENYYVYPTVIQKPDGELEQLDEDKAFKHAKKNNEYIKFDNPDDADWFSKNYKKVWERDGGAGGDDGDPKGSFWDQVRANIKNKKNGKKTTSSEFLEKKQNYLRQQKVGSGDVKEAERQQEELPDTEQPGIPKDFQLYPTVSKEEVDKAIREGDQKPVIEPGDNNLTTKRQRQLNKMIGVNTASDVTKSTPEAYSNEDVEAVKQQKILERKQEWLKQQLIDVNSPDFQDYTPPEMREIDVKNPYFKLLRAGEVLMPPLHFLKGLVNEYEKKSITSPNGREPNLQQETSDDVGEFLSPLKDSALKESLTSIIQPIMEGVNQVNRSDDDKDILPKIADLTLGYGKVIMNSMPQIVGLNAMNPQLKGMVGDISTELGGTREAGEEAANLLGMAVFGKRILLASLGSGLLGDVTKSVLEGNDMSDDDKERIIEVAQQLGFFGALGLTGKGTGKFKEITKSILDKSLGPVRRTLLGKNYDDILNSSRDTFLNRLLNKEGRVKAYEYYVDQLGDRGRTDAEKQTIRDIIDKGFPDLKGQDIRPIVSMDRGNKLGQGKFKAGDNVQWVSKDIEQFPEPKPITKLKGGFAFFEGSKTGVPVEELVMKAPSAADTQIKEDEMKNPPAPLSDKGGTGEIATGDEVIVQRDMGKFKKGDKLTIVYNPKVYKDMVTAVDEKGTKGLTQKSNIIRAEVKSEKGKVDTTPNPLLKTGVEQVSENDYQAALDKLKGENRINVDDTPEVIHKKITESKKYSSRTGSSKSIVEGTKHAIDNIFKKYSPEKPLKTDGDNIYADSSTDITHLFTSDDDREPGKRRYANNKMEVLKNIDKFFNEAQIRLTRKNGDVWFIKENKNKNDLVVTRSDEKGKLKLWSINPGKTDKKVKEWIDDSVESRSRKLSSGSVSSLLPDSSVKAQGTSDTNIAKKEEKSNNKYEENRKKGFFEREGNKFERPVPEKVNKLQGKETEVRFSKDETEKAKYSIIEAEDLQPTHQNGNENPYNFLREGQPRNRSELKALQNAAKDKAENLRAAELGSNPMAYFGAPIVNTRGEVFQGTGRSEALKYYYENFPKDPKGYKKYLADNSEEFGLKPDEISKFKNPVLVRMADIPDERAIKLGNFDVKDLEDVSQNMKKITKADINKLDSGKSAEIADMLGATADEDTTLKSAIRELGSKIVKKLQEADVIKAEESELYLNEHGDITAQGVDNIYTFFKQLLFKGGDENLPEIFEKISYTVRQGIEKSIPDIMGVEGNKSIRPELQNAILGLRELEVNRVSSPKLTVDEWMNQESMFNDTPSEAYSETELELIKVFDSAKKQSYITEFFKDYRSIVSDKAADLFNPETKGLNKTEGLGKLLSNENGKNTSTSSPKAETEKKRTEDLTGSEKEKTGSNRQDKTSDSETGGNVKPDSLLFQKDTRKQTDTPEFKKWFGDSKVVDKDGQPLVVYHGTWRDFDGEFQGKLIFFSDNAHYSSMFAGSIDPNEGAKPQVYPVFLKIENPLDLTSLGDKKISAKKFIDYLEEKGIELSKTVKEAIQSDSPDKAWFYINRSGEFLKPFLKKAGYDGIIQKESIPPNKFGLGKQTAKAYVAFEPGQIKSALSNIGSFDSENPNILFQKDKSGEYSNKFIVQKALEEEETRLLERLKTAEFKLGEVSEYDTVSRRLSEVRKEIALVKKQISELKPKDGFTKGQMMLFHKGVMDTRATEGYLNAVVSRMSKAFPNVDVEISNDKDIRQLMIDRGYNLLPGERTPFGLFDKGKVLINGDKASIDTPIHEFSHVWVDWAKKEKPGLWDIGMKIIKESPELVDAVKKDYPDLLGDDLYNEVLARAVSIKGVDILNSESPEAQSLYKRFVAWLKRLWEAVKEKFTSTEESNVQKLDMDKATVSDFAHAVAKDLLEGDAVDKRDYETSRSLFKKALIVATLLHPTEAGNILPGHAQDVKGPTDIKHTERIKITDDRKRDVSTGKPVTDRNNFTGNYDAQIIKDIVRIANKNNIDPYTFIAMALQETNLGEAKGRFLYVGDFPDESNDSATGMQGFNMSYDKPPKEFDEMADGPYKKFIKDYPKLELFNSDSMDDFTSEVYFNRHLKDLDESGLRKHILQLQADFLKKRLKIADGLGFNKSEAQKLQAWNGYGNKHFINDAPFGKRVIDLRDNVIKKNPKLVELVKTELLKKSILVDGKPVLHKDPFANPFYSQMEKVMDSKMPKSATVEQVKNILKSGAIKQDEIEWSGINEWLDEREKAKGKSEKVSKEELQEFLKDNRLKLEEKVQEDSDYEPSDDEINSEARLIAIETGENWKELGPNGRQNFINQAKARIKSEHGTTKFAKFTLPGGENYKEILFKLPFTFDELPQGYEIKKAGDEYQLTGPGEDIIASGYQSKEGLLAEAHLFGVKINKLSKGDIYTSSHFDNPNILAHARINDRIIESENAKEFDKLFEDFNKSTDEKERDKIQDRLDELLKGKDKKILFVEEIQSDWHQEGRKKGYRTAEKRDWDSKTGQNAIEVVKKNNNFGFDSWQSALSAIAYDDDFETSFNFLDEKSLEVITKWRENAVREKKNLEKVPNAPLKKTWPEFVLKNLLRKAVEQGYDSIGWTTGEQQNERYDLSKQVGGILYQRRENGNYDIKYIGLRGGGEWKIMEHGNRNSSNIPATEIEDWVGKDIAKKITESEKVDGIFKGDGLKVSGQGMKGFYDNIIPNFLNKYTKKWGGKVESTKLPDGRKPEYKFSYTEKGDIIVHENEWSTHQFPTLEKAQAWVRKAEKKAEGKTIHSLEITPEMRASLLYEGQPMFQRDVDREREKLVDTIGTWHLQKDKDYSLWKSKMLKDIPDLDEDSIQKVYNKLTGKEVTEPNLFGKSPKESHNSLMTAKLINDVKTGRFKKGYFTTNEGRRLLIRLDKNGLQVTMIENGKFIQKLSVGDFTRGIKDGFFVKYDPNLSLPGAKTEAEDRRKELETLLPAIFEGKTDEMRMELGIGLGAFLSDDVVGRLKEYWKDTKEFGKSAKEFGQDNFAPAKVDDAAASADAITANYIMEHVQYKNALMKGREKRFNWWEKVPEEMRLDFMNRMEHGWDFERGVAPKFIKPFTEIAASYVKDLQEVYRMEKVDLGLKINFVKNYFTHIWENTDEEIENFIKDSVERLGNDRFTNHRDIDLIKEGLEWGLKLVSSNPEWIVINRMIAADKVKTRREMMDVYKKHGLALDFEKYGMVEPGNALVEVAGKKYVVPVSVGRLINTALSEIGLRERKDLIGKIYRGWMTLKSIGVRNALSLSGFHPVFITFQNTFHNISRVLENIFKYSQKSNVDITDLFKDTATSLVVPWSQSEAMYKGWEVVKAWDKMPENMTDLERWQIQLVKEGGGNLRMSDLFQTNIRRNFRRAINKGNYIGAGLRIPGAILEYSQAPVFEYFVPSLKAMAYLKDAEMLLKRRPELETNDLERMKALRPLWKSIDNRFGMLNYDTLFINKMVKDIMTGTFLSFSWTLGDLREFTGAPVDGLRFVLNGLKTGKFKREDISTKMFFVMVTAGITMMIGGLMTYGLTGETPKNLKDYFYPRTGRKNPDGSDERVSIPGYHKDFFSWYQNVKKEGGFTSPTGIIKGTYGWFENKAAPILHQLMEVWGNKDYYGYQIYNPEDNKLQILEDISKYLVKEMLPISVKGFLQGQSATSKWGSIFGFSPAPSYITRTDIQNEIYTRFSKQQGDQEKGADQKETDEMKKQVKELYNKGDHDGAKELLDEFVDSKKLSEKSAAMFENNLGVPGDQVIFRRLNVNNQTALIKKMEPQELDVYMPLLNKKLKEEPEKLKGLSDTLDDWLLHNDKFGADEKSQNTMMSKLPEETQKQVKEINKMFGRTGMKDKAGRKYYYHLTKEEIDDGVIDNDRITDLLDNREENLDKELDAGDITKDFHDAQIDAIKKARVEWGKRK